MSKRTRELFERLKQGTQEAMQDIAAELKQLANHGRTEAAAALFNGSPFVMYMRETHTTEQATGHGVDKEANEQTHERLEQQRERDQGMEL